MANVVTQTLQWAFAPVLGNGTNTNTFNVLAQIACSNLVNYAMTPSASNWVSTSFNVLATNILKFQANGGQLFGTNPPAGQIAWYTNMGLLSGLPSSPGAIFMTIPHGIGQVPTSVRCVFRQSDSSNDGGYPAASEVDVSAFVDANTNPAVAYGCDATNIYFSASPNMKVRFFGLFGAVQSVTYGDWYLKFYLKP
jgi:hypothetical protein